jgi:enamine deaminase RidA (YjgF/YER057c/UK114 family)
LRRPRSANAVLPANGRFTRALESHHRRRAPQPSTSGFRAPHVDLRRHLHAFIKVKDEFVRPPYPAWTAIGITELITEGTLVEIRAVARRGRDKES